LSKELVGKVSNRGNIMISKVEAARELAEFDELWMESWREKGYGFEDSKKALGRFLFMCEGEYVGTIEFKLFKNSTIEEIFSFSSFQYIKDNIEHVAEIDKLSIKKENRKKQILNHILSLMTHFAEDNHIRYYIALIEPKLFFSLKAFYHLPVKKLGRKFFYKGDDVIPISFDVRIVNQNKDKYEWLMDRAVTRI
jgi:hypothetical protein